MKKNCLCLLFAQEFNLQLDKLSLSNYKLYMINTFVAMTETADADHYIFEGFIDGEYVKYTNNWDYFNDSPKIDTRPFTAFSHFTYFLSEGK